MYQLETEKVGRSKLIYFIYKFSYKIPSISLTYKNLYLYYFSSMLVRMDVI